MKGDDYLYLGLAAGAAYLIYKSTKGITKTIEDVGGGVGDAVGGVGEGIGEIGSSTGSAFSNIIGTASDVVSSNLSLLNLKEDFKALTSDFGSIWGFLQTQGTNEKNDAQGLQGIPPANVTTYATTRINKTPAKISVSNPFAAYSNKASATITQDNPFAYNPNISLVTGQTGQALGNKIFIGV